MHCRVSFALSSEVCFLIGPRFLIQRCRRNESVGILPFSRRPPFWVKLDPLPSRWCTNFFRNFLILGTVTHLLKFSYPPFRPPYNSADNFSRLTTFLDPSLTIPSHIQLLLLRLSPTIPVRLKIPRRLVRSLCIPPSYVIAFVSLFDSLFFFCAFPGTIVKLHRWFLFASFSHNVSKA